jgi:(1->4)-alpha-D-glucan 1-alpha-D-glucosylmutase
MNEEKTLWTENLSETTTAAAGSDGQTPESNARIPLAVYRLQFNRSFTFAAAARLVPYLYDLGVSDGYASPYFKACPGSAHGYDVIDHNAFNPELGDEEDYNAFVTALQQHGMGQLLDMVPNHMGIAKSYNPWWADVLENGPSSLYASCFDIDWNPVKPELANKVLLPILGAQYGRVLENQELTLCYEEGTFSLRYFDHCLPIAPRPVVAVLAHRLGDLEHLLGREHPQVLELRSIITALTHLPLRTETDREKVIERSREKEIIKKRLAVLTAASAEVRAFLNENVSFFNGAKGEPRTFDPLDRLLDDQAYRLAYWRVAAEEINYRRFFDVNELAAIRTEDPVVFVVTHHLLLRLLAEQKVTGMRLDHVDGLYDPAGYLRRLQHAAGQAMHGGTVPALPPLWQTSPVARQLVEEPDPAAVSRPCFLVVEKILGEGEYLPEHWPVYGTTGYEFLNLLNGIFVDQAAETRLTNIYNRFTRSRINFVDLVYESKKLIMQVSLSSELNVLAHQLDHLSERDRHSRDFTLNSLAHALREIIACFPVYRTYIDDTGVTDRDRAVIETAVARAQRKNPATDVSIFHFVRDILLLRFSHVTTEEDRQAQRAFVMKLQQYTGPVMAKGLEDTAFYIYNRLVSLNEVGGAPQRFGASLAAFHQHNRERLERYPFSLLTTTTHDTKRSEDVRACINVLSEIPEEWRTALNRWSKLNRKKKLLVDGHPVPDRNEEYLLYQTLLGAWPLTPMGGDDYAVFKLRIQDYMRKATKEAKVNTSWINPNQAYDDALQDFVAAVLDNFLFLAEFQTFRSKIAQYGMYNSLSQTLLKLTVPGVPDIYQGNELWDFSLVDPDKRRPVDFARRRQLLSALLEQSHAAGYNLRDLAHDLLIAREDGRIKLYITHRTLCFRRKHPELFLRGAYIPIEANGMRHQHVCAFARQYEQYELLVVAPRFFSRLIPDPQRLPVGPQVWGDTSLTVPATEGSRCRYRNVFTGEAVATVNGRGGMKIALELVFAHFPVALLMRE